MQDYLYDLDSIINEMDFNDNYFIAAYMPGDFGTQILYTYAAAFQLPVSGVLQVPQR